jgi:hypothetical protein
LVQREEAPTEHVQIRAAIGMAEVEFDGSFAASPSVIEAFRLVRSRALKRVLARSPGPLAVIASAHFYREVVRRVPAARAEAYRQVRVRTKEGRANAWIYAPRQPAPGWRDTLALLTTGRGLLAGATLRHRAR